MLKRRIALLALSLGVQLFFSSCDEQRSNYFENYQEILEFKAIEKGMIPVVIPSSSKEIYQFNYTDAGGTYVRFAHDDKGRREVERNTIKLGPKELTDLHKYIVGYPNWWPDNLKKDSIKNLAITHTYDVYLYKYTVEYRDRRKEEKRGYFFFKANSNIAYYCGN